MFVEYLVRGTSYVLSLSSIEYLVRGTSYVLSLSLIIQIPGVARTVHVKKKRRRRAKGLGIRTTNVKQSDGLQRTTSLYQLRKFRLLSIVRGIELKPTGKGIVFFL